MTEAERQILENQTDIMWSLGRIAEVVRSPDRQAVNEMLRKAMYDTRELLEKEESTK